MMKLFKKKYYLMEMLNFLVIIKYMNLNALIKICQKQEVTNALILKVRFIIFNLFLEFWKIVNKFDEKDQVISYFYKLGLKSTINLHSSIIYQFPSPDSKKYKPYKSYKFPLIEDSFFQDKSITKYEIPQYIPDIPEGFSVFCTLWEASKVKQYMLMSQEEQEKLNIKENYDKQEKENNLEEPIPKTNFCYICREKFEDYFAHLETRNHINNLYEENIYYSKTIKNTFKRINKYWNNDISEEISRESNNEEQNEDIKSNETANDDNNNININVKYPILTSTVISLLNEDIYEENEENDLDNKENIDTNKNEIVLDNYKYNYGNNFNLKGNNNNKKRDFTSFKLLKKKRITFDVIRYESPNNKNLELKRDYFNYLNKYKKKEFIKNIIIFFE